MAWWAYIPAVLTAVAGYTNSQQIESGGESQASWMRYNAQMDYNTAQANIAATSGIASMNAKAAAAAASTTREAQLMATELQEDTAFLNANMVLATTRYNNMLLEDEVELLWEQTGLDLELLANQRAVERGSIEAAQSASGTVMGTGSNAQVLIDQQTQEALDAFVVRHGANIQAAKLTNTMSQNAWQGKMEAKKIAWEGQLGATISRVNANTQYGNTMLQAAAGVAEAGISGAANALSAQSKFRSDSYGAMFHEQNTEQQAQNSFTNGLFSAASAAVSTATLLAGESLVTG